MTRNLRLTSSKDTATSRILHDASNLATKMHDIPNSFRRWTCTYPWAFWIAPVVVALAVESIILLYSCVCYFVVHVYGVWLIPILQTPGALHISLSVSAASVRYIHKCETMGVPCAGACIACIMWTSLFVLVGTVRQVYLWHPIIGLGLVSTAIYSHVSVLALMWQYTQHAGFTVGDRKVLLWETCVKIAHIVFVQGCCLLLNTENVLTISPG